LYLAEGGALASVPIQITRIGADQRAGRAAAAFLLVVAILLAVSIPGRSALREFAWRWPYAAAAAAGVFWWLHLRPSVLGLVWIAAVFAYAVGRLRDSLGDGVQGGGNRVQDSFASRDPADFDQSSADQATDIF
jgi:hypothetical protein